MADLKDIAINQVIKNFPKLGKFLEEALYISLPDGSYNPATGLVSYAGSSEKPFKGVFLKASGGSAVSTYPVSNFPDLPPLKQDDLKMIVSNGSIYFNFKNDSIVTYKSKQYRIITVYNISDIATICFLRLLKVN